MNRHIFKALLIKIGILGLGFFSTMVITRILTIEDVGLYIFFISTTMLLCFFLDFGCNSSFFKLINSSHTNAKLDLVNKQKSELLSFKVSFVSLLLIITVPVFFIAFFINDTFSLNYYILIVISSSILTFQLSFSTLNRATGNFVLSQLNYELIPNIIRIALLSIVYFLGLKANEFYWVICVILISTSLPLLNNIYANKHLMLNIKISISCVVRIVRNNSGLAWVALVLYCHTQLDVILLQLMGSNHDVGGYGIANRISSLFALTLGVANFVVPN
jgi:O-antigen/teichoic acid export membrane protein